jgi:hypothetical protein
MNCEYVRKYYEVPAEIGRRVVIDGKPGIIAKDMGQYIGVLLDCDKPKNIMPYHPTHLVEYGEMGKVRKMTRAQARYQEYLDSECDESFAWWLGVDKPKTITGPSEHDVWPSGYLY